MNQDETQSRVQSTGGSNVNTSGYACITCGAWVTWGYLHNCNTMPPYYPPQTTIYTNILPSETTEKLDRILEELQEIKELLK